MKPPTLNPKFAEVIVEPPSSNRKRLTTINRTVRNNSIEDNQIIEDNPITKCSKDLSSNSSEVMSRDIIKEDNHFMEDNRIVEDNLSVTVKINPSRISSEVISINDDIEDNQIVEDNQVANCIRNSMVTTINVAESVPKENNPSDKNPIIVN